MALRSGSFSRSLISTARASSLRSSPSLPRLRQPPSTPPLSGTRVQSRRLSFVTTREEWKRWVMREDLQSIIKRQEDGYTLYLNLLMT